MAAGPMPDLTSEEQHRRWLFGDVPCRCDHAIRPLGVLHDLQMGDGWVRITTHPDCPWHGTKAQRIFKQTGRWPDPRKDER